MQAGRPGLKRLIRLILVLALAVGGPLPAAAELNPDFTFKRVKVGRATPDSIFKRVKAPSPGTRKRITVQITPGPAPAPSAPRQEDAPPGPRIRQGPVPGPSSFAFFWAAVPPATGLAAAERMALALATLEQARATGTPLFGRQETIGDIAAGYRDELVHAARTHGVSAALLVAVIAVESGGKTRALSPKGAQGLMQLMPGTAARFGVSEPWEAAANIGGGAAYLDFLLGLFGDDPLLALAGYNAGENAVIRNSGVPPYAETRDYVPKVLGAWMQARLLCAVPPATVRDPCDLGPAELVIRFSGPF